MVLKRLKVIAFNEQRIVVISIILFVLSFVCASLWNPEVLFKYVYGPLFYDERHYTHISELGYQTGAAAFHPLLPIILTLIQSVSGGEILWGRLFSFFLFVFSLISLHKLLLRLVLARTAALFVILYAINPFSIFHALTYTESLFALLSLLLLDSILEFIANGKGKSIALAALLSGLMALTRPTHLMFAASILGAILLGLLFNRKDALEQKRSHGILLISLLSNLIFTGAYFGFLSVVKGDFFSALKSQDGFGRKLGIYWEHIVSPKSLNGSDNILAWEIQCFYLPLIAFGIYSLFPSIRKALKGPAFYIFWFCVLFASAHVGVNMLTHPRFYSLGRHVMGQPFLFIVMALLLNSVPHTKLSKGIAWFYVFACFVYLTMTWERFANVSWIG